MSNAVQKKISQSENVIAYKRLAPSHLHLVVDHTDNDAIFLSITPTKRSCINNNSYFISS